MLKEIISGTLGAGVLLTSCGAGHMEKNTGDPLPNIIFIIADDLGFGDVGFQGQKLFSTPNIDRLASEGLVFTNHYSGSTVCAPSRSSLMTGQHTGHTYIRGNREHQPEGQEPLPAGTLTVARMLQSAGYVTGAFGKWGLGYPGSEGDPNSQGFNEFFGYNCQRIGHNYYPYHLWHNQEKIVLEGNSGRATGQYAPEVIHTAAMSFLEKNKDKPFFMYYPSIIPHAELVAPEKYLARYRGKFIPEKEYKGYDEGPLFRLGPYGSQSECRAAHAAMISVLDDQVGEIMAQLKDLGIADKTLVIFTSDNGPHLEGGADPDYFNSNGPFRGYKRDLYEGGIRVPFIAWWPGKIAPGTTDHISAFWDFMPTMAELTGIELPESLDGISFMPVLTGNPGKQKKHDFLYWEFHERGLTQAVRMDNWKAVRKGLDQEIELYDLNTDIAETKNIAGAKLEIVRKIEEILEGSRTNSALWPVTTGNTE
jgi:arylsulfatase A